MKKTDQENEDIEAKSDKVEVVAPTPSSTDVASVQEKNLSTEEADDGGGGSCSMRFIYKILKKNVVTIATVVGVIAGIIIGAILKATRDGAWSKRESKLYVGFLGHLFLNMLKIIIIPLIIPSLITAVGSMNMKLSGRVGTRALVYYLVTTVLAVILGIILVIIIAPGVSGGQANVPESKGQNVTTADTLMDLVRNCFPPNLLQATLQQYKTVIIYPGENITTDPDSGLTIDPEDQYSWQFKEEWTSGTNLLGLIVFSLVTGVAIASVGETGESLLELFQSVSAVMMKITTWIIMCAPVGVCSLVASQLLTYQNIGEEFRKIGWYFMTVLLGLAIHGFIVLPLLYLIVVRRNPLRYE